MQDTQFMSAGFGPNRRIFKRRARALRRRIAVAVVAGACLAAWAAVFGSAYTSL